MNQALWNSQRNQGSLAAVFLGEALSQISGEARRLGFPSVQQNPRSKALDSSPRVRKHWVCLAGGLLAPRKITRVGDPHFGQRGSLGWVSQAWQCPDAFLGSPFAGSVDLAVELESERGVLGNAGRTGCPPCEKGTCREGRRQVWIRVSGDRPWAPGGLGYGSSSTTRCWVSASATQGDQGPQTDQRGGLYCGSGSSEGTATPVHLLGQRRSTSRTSREPPAFLRRAGHGCRARHVLRVHALWDWLSTSAELADGCAHRALAVVPASASISRIPTSPALVPSQTQYRFKHAWEIPRLLSVNCTPNCWVFMDDLGLGGTRLEGPQFPRTRCARPCP